MRFYKFFLVLLLSFSSAKAVEVPCEQITIISAGFRCDMNGTTQITSDMKISDARNESVTGLYLTLNSKIFFLPIEMHEKFPNLLAIEGRHCSISTISKNNFNKLIKLELLNLSSNKIEKIESNTFDDLVNLREIRLEYNKIKFINGKLFEMKPKLARIDLKRNACINDDIGARRIEVLQSFLPEITAQCGFVEKPISEIKLSSISCGSVSYAEDRVICGSEIDRGQWPFLVALILASNGTFFCGGNLISSKHVLTAAHCLHAKGQTKQLEAKEVVVLLGRHDLKALYERDSKQREVAEIVMHPNWKNDTQKYDSDLSILVLQSEVQFSDFIQPVCFTKDAAIMDHFIGTVVGWGKSESEAVHVNIPRQVSIRAVNADICFDKDYDLGKIYSPTTFCAGGEGVGPCTGDSGGGFFVNFRGLWTLRGMVSAGALSSSGFSCDVGRYTLFTKLVDFFDWIRETVERT